MYLYHSLLALVLGFIIDLILGDPHSLWHPVCSIGKLITKIEKSIRKETDTQKQELGKGIVLVCLVCVISSGIPLILLWLSYGLHKYVGIAVESIMCYQLLATKSLKDESMKVYDKLRKHDLKQARYAVSMIVGRDTNCLDEAGITKAAVETVAENTSDGIIAPMLYMAIGGAVFGFFYKAVNTMDSMVGYKNETYLYFGRAAAKLDDVLNFVPARVSAWLMIVSTIFLRSNGKQAVKIYRRDRFNHASPNSAHTEAVVAGALGVQLAGDAYYFGKLNKKKTIGDDLRPIEIEDIKRTNQMLYMSATIALALFSVVKVVLLWLL